MSRPALFRDRDGMRTQERGYTEADAILGNLMEAVGWILRSSWQS